MAGVLPGVFRQGVLAVVKRRRIGLGPSKVEQYVLYLYFFDCFLREGKLLERLSCEQNETNLSILQRLA